MDKHFETLLYDYGYEADMDGAEDFLNDNGYAETVDLLLFDSEELSQEDAEEIVRGIMYALEDTGVDIEIYY